MNTLFGDNRVLGAIPWLMLFVGTYLPTYAQEYSKKESTIASDIRSGFLNASRGKAKGAAARRLLVGRSAQEIQAMCFDEDPSVALCAAWYRLELQMQAHFVGSDRAATVVPIPNHLTREFLGFIEGRLHVPAPDQWSKDLELARYSRWGSALFPSNQPAMAHLGALEPGNPRTGERASLPQVLLSLKSPAHATFLGRESYEGEDAVAHLPDEVVAAIKKANHDTGRDVAVTGISADGLAAIAIPGDGPGSDELNCISATGAKGTPKVLWRNQMDSYWAEGFQGASWYTEFRISRGLLYLFHCTHDSIGIECVKFSNGAPVFSFNSRLP